MLNKTKGHLSPLDRFSNAEPFISLLDKETNRLLAWQLLTVKINKAVNLLSLWS